MMATPEPSGRVLTLEGMRDALNSKKSEIEAAHGRLGGKVVGQKGTTASSKMQVYRSGQRAINHYNQTVRKKQTEDRSPDTIRNLAANFLTVKYASGFSVWWLGCGKFRGTRHSMPYPEAPAFVSRSLPQKSRRGKRK